MTINITIVEGTVIVVCAGLLLCFLGLVINELYS